jgi:hypothetical protein
MLVAARRWPWLAGASILGLLAYTRAPVRRLRRRAPALSPGERIAVAGLVPVIRATGDVAKMVGYPFGIWRRLRDAALRHEVAAYWRGQ